MVKLIRLTTANNGKFKADFDAEILVPPGSKIALQNLVFKTTFTPISIGGDDRLITFTADKVKRPLTGTPLSALPNGAYTGADGKIRFTEDLQNALNSSLGSIASQPPPLGQGLIANSTFSDFNVGNWDGGDDDADKNNFGWAPCLLGTPLGGTFAMSNPTGTKNAPWWLWDDDLFEANDTQNTLSLDRDLPATTGTEYHMITPNRFRMSKGSALFMVRIKNSVLPSIQPQGLQNNGFGIGLTTENLESLGYPKNENLPDADREYEIRYNYSSIVTPATRESYYYRVKGGVEQDSQIKPQHFETYISSPHPNWNDVVWFRINPDPDNLGKQILTAGVWQINAATIPAPATPLIPVERIIFSRQLTREEQNIGFKPYLYITGMNGEGTPGESARTQLDAMCYTLSNDGNWETGNEGTADWRDSINAIGGSTPGNDYDILQIFKTGPTASRGGAEIRLGPVTPILDYNRWKNVPNVPTPIADLKLSNSVWRYLGFTEFDYEDSDGYATIEKNVAVNLLIVPNDPPNPKFNYIAAEWEGDIAGKLDSNDAFIVETVNLPLDCYDASSVFYGIDDSPAPKAVSKRGRRKNILMTLPVNDNTNGLVQYDSNTPVFIDIKNTAPILLKNLSLNILTKDWIPIVTEGNEAIITLLLDTGK